jgi:hypothetical protein
MGNGYGTLGHGVFVTFLLRPANYNQSEKLLSTSTNLHNVVQNPDERIAILEQGHQVSSINSHRMKTHFRNTCNFCHLYLILSAVVRVIWRRFCGSSDWPGPEEDALCSETPDEDALIRSRWWILLSIQQTKGISACQGELTGGD